MCIRDSNATDLGIAKAMEKFDTTVVGATLSDDANTHADLATSCYKSTTFIPNQVEARGLPKLLLDPTTTQAPDGHDAQYQYQPQRPHRHQLQTECQHAIPCLLYTSRCV